MICFPLPSTNIGYVSPRAQFSKFCPAIRRDTQEKRGCFCLLLFSTPTGSQQVSKGGLLLSPTLKRLWHESISFLSPRGLTVWDIGNAQGVLANWITNVYSSSTGSKTRSGGTELQGDLQCRCCTGCSVGKSLHQSSVNARAFLKNITSS
jgi:hypothetical protein